MKVRNPKIPIKPERVLTLGYITTLALVAFLTGLSNFVIHLYIVNEENAGTAISMIADQQIGVQKLLLNTNLIGESISPERRELLWPKVNKALKELDEIDQKLTEDIFRRSFWNLGAWESKILDQSDISLYYQASKLMGDLSKQAKKLEDMQSVPTLSPLGFEVIREKANGISSILSLIRDHHATERREKINTYRNIQLVSYIFTITILLLAALFVFRPIATHVRSERLALARAKVAADRANATKSEFLTNISHEIRTPIGSVLGSADIILINAGDQDLVTKNIKSIKRSGSHLKLLIDDLLDLSKIETGNVEVVSRPIELSHLLHEVDSLMSVRAAEKELGFEIAIVGDVPQEFESDPLRIRQILINLVGNALKFTDRGKVKIQVHQKIENNVPFLVFDVIDTGCGIAEESQIKLFKRFSQVDSSLNRKAGGTGLGLALSQKLASNLGGRLNLVESKVGKGSTFRFSLELRQPSTTMISNFERIRESSNSPGLEHLRGVLAGKTILLVEDGPENQRIFMHFLNYAGAKALLAKNGLEGVELAKKHEHEISLVLMDIQMPELDGHSATRQLRADGFSQPIVALTAHAFQEEIDRCLLGGFSAYQTKPVDIPELVELMMTLTAGEEVSPTKETPIVSIYADRPAYQELIGEFVTSLPSYIDKLVEVSQSHQWQETQDIAHTLKGTAGTYGFPDLSKLAGEVEDYVRNSDSGEMDAKSIEDAVKVLRDHCQLIYSAAPMSGNVTSKNTDV